MNNKDFFDDNGIYAMSAWFIIFLCDFREKEFKVGWLIQSGNFMWKYAL